MTVKELTELLISLGPEEQESKVCVSACGGIGATGVPVSGITLGFDWDNGKVILHTYKPLQRMPEKKKR